MRKIIKLKKIKVRKPKKPRWFKPRFKDSDKDGVMDYFDCKPHNKRKQEIFNIHKMKNKNKVLKGNLYHKTDFENLKKIMREDSLKTQTGRVISLSEDSNVNVKTKKYKQPIVLVFDKDKIPGKRKMEYDRGEGHFRGEKEWTTEHFPVKKALKGVIMNEHFERLGGELDMAARIGRPTRYVTEDDILKVKFKNEF